MAPVELEVVDVYKTLVDSLLDRAADLKPDKQIEPPLTEALLGEAIWQVPREFDGIVLQLNQQTQFAAVEIAFREKFYRILASTSIDDPNFINIWNLLDIVSIFSDNEQCEPGLIFWLIEELLDSQTIDGCRTVFDYLESRRERNIRKHFKQKNLIILRSCNELLRRLSRAEDTVFCGRVFIFLFQSFPLGDKSSVNLRGEFHTDNVTTFDDISKPPPANNDEDMTMTEANDEAPIATETHGESGQSQEPGSRPHTPKIVVSGSQKKTTADQVDLGELYPLFWGLQAYFSAPTKTFDADRFASFKAALEATLTAFKNINTELEKNSSSRQTEEDRKSHKRKRVADEAEVGTSFNPKYLTSRDLFDLEVSDEAFRRHVLVQALILLDFLLSLNPKAKARLTDSTNKSVLYGFTLNEDDTKWVTAMRSRIEGYLQQGVGGKFYYRMVDTVLSRDKNWVRWKAEGCPPIERPAVSVPESMAARKEASKLYTNKRLRASPMGALDLKFLSDSEALTNVERLKEGDRYSVPAAKSYMGKILDAEMDIDMAEGEEKEDALRAKSSYTWRILRLSAKTKLAAFDKIGDGHKLDALFEAPAGPAETLGDAEDTEDAKDTPKEAEEVAEEPAIGELIPEESKQNQNTASEENTTIDQGPPNSSATAGDKTTEADAAT